MKAPRETDLVKACLGLLAIRGITAWRNNSGATLIGGRLVRFGHPGSSDILGLLPGSGRFLAVECKMPGQKLRPKQAHFLACIRAAGGLALVVRDVAELDAALAKESGDRDVAPGLVGPYGAACPVPPKPAGDQP